MFSHQRVARALWRLSRSPLRQRQDSLIPGEPRAGAAGRSRRDLRRAAALIIVPLALMLWLLPLEGDYAFLVLLPIVTVAALTLGPAAGALATVASVAAADYFFLEPIHEFGLTADDYPSLAVYLMACAIVCYLAHRLQRARQASAPQIARDIRAAEERQRRQIARELHDDLSQTLAAARIRLGGLCGAAQDEVRGEARKVAALIDLAVLATRTLTSRLAPPALGDRDLAPALAGLVDEVAQSFGLRVTIRHDGRATGLRPDQRAALYQAARELLINVAKHAGTRAARIDLRCRAGQVRLAVADGGIGLDAARMRGPGLGLAIVRERVLAIGGRLRLRSTPGRGTIALLTVRVTAPPVPAVQAPGTR